ncbi:MAG: hypothetical protein WDN76_06500 [Alphaproteobacteria bacterium]
MSDVSFIRAAPPPGTIAPRRTADAPQQTAREPEARREKISAPAALPNKTIVKAEQISKYAFGYTFIDTATAQVVGRYPAEPFVTSNARVSKTV